MQPAHDKATIYVPVAGSRLERELLPGSGIVGIPRHGQLVIYYEGNLYGACNLHRIEDRIICAFGRLATKYPTGAMRGVLDEEIADLIPVGEVAWPNRVSIHEDKRAALAAYADQYQHQA
ncbi:MAG: hypothetical protein KJZ90_00065 [Rhodocyclaceae bacterium]|nr:hypothetical protein [Rhodocyclaceae bacterium]